MKFFCRKPEITEVKQIGKDVFFSGAFGKSTLKRLSFIRIFVEPTRICLSSSSKKHLKMYFIVIRNHIFGVSYGFNKKLRLKGVGFFFEKVDKLLLLSIGFSHKVKINIPNNIDLIIKKKRFIFIFGDSLEDVTRFCSIIRGFKVPDRYKGKGVLRQHERLILREGKKS